MEGFWTEVSPADAFATAQAADPSTTAWLDSLDTSDCLDGLPELPPSVPSPAQGAASSGKARSRRPAAKRVRQNAEAQRAYRRREKAQKGRIATATFGMQKYIAEADEHLDHLISLVFDDEVIVERLMNKLASATAAVSQTVPKLSRNVLLAASECTVKCRRRAEAHQRQLLSLPGDKFIEGEVEALAWLSKEVATHKKAAVSSLPTDSGKELLGQQDRGGRGRSGGSSSLTVHQQAQQQDGGSKNDKWSQLALLPEAFGLPHDITVSDVLLAFVRFGV